MEIRLANLNDIEKIATFHSEQFSDYYLTQLGKNVLCKYYEFFINSKENRCFISIKDGTIVGLGLFLEDFEEQIAQFYSQNKTLLAVSILKSLLKCNKIVWEGTYERVKNMFTISSVDSDLPKLTLLSLAVSEKFRGKGIGKELLEHAEKYYQEKGKTRYYLSVLAHNTKAIGFYEKNNFVKLKQKGKIYYMEKEI